MPDHNEVIILGAGISGLTAAYLLNRQGKDVHVIDHYEHCGGNHLSKQIDGYTFDIGAIFFWSDNPQFEMFGGLRQTCVPIDFSARKLAPSGKIVSYPYDVSEELWTQNLRRMTVTIGSLLRARLSRGPVTSAADFAIRRIGKRLYADSGLQMYLDRFYGIPGHEVSATFARRRMMWIRDRSSVRKAITRNVSRVYRPIRREHHPPLQAYARPFEGFGRYYGTIEAYLREKGVRFTLDTSIDRLTRRSAQHIVSTSSGPFEADRLISSLPTTMTASLCGMKEERLKALALTTLFCVCDGRPAFDSTILYNFHKAGLWKRLTVHSSYYGKVEGRHYFSVECTQLDPQLSAASLFESFDSHARANNLFTGRLRLVGFSALNNAYPVYKHGFEAILSGTIDFLRTRGVETIGRQGNFDYIPSSTHAIELVRAALN